MANLNYHLDIEYEENWNKFKRNSLIRPSLDSEMRYTDVASESLQIQLREMMTNLLTISDLSLTDMVGLLGYSSDFDTAQYHSSKCPARGSRGNS